MTALGAGLVVLLLQAQAVRLDARTPSVDRMLADFERDYHAVRAAVAPGVDVDVELPEAELYIEGQRAIAYTLWDDRRMVMRADWRALYVLPGCPDGVAVVVHRRTAA